MQVRSFLRNIHYFEVDAFGGYKYIPKQPGEIRAVVPILASRYQHALGFLNSNDLGVSVTPLSSGSRSVYQAVRSEAALTGWIDDADVRPFFDRANQYLLMEGTVGYHRYIDKFRQNVFMKALPGSQIFPIPHDARDPSELSGLIYASLVTKSWLEAQDEEVERLTGSPPLKRMADKAKGIDRGLFLNYPGLGLAGRGGKIDGALTLTVWMKKTPQVPTGEYYFFVGDEIHRAALGYDENGVSRTQDILANGELTTEIVYFHKNPEDFYGTGFCEMIVPSQFSVNRQMTTWEKNTRLNRPLTYFDSDVIPASKAQGEIDGFIPFAGRSMDPGRKSPVFHFPSSPVNRDLVGLMEVQRQFADESAGMRSGILFGQQEGRTESGPATSLLAQNAAASFHSPLARTAEAWRKTYLGVLDMLKVAWPNGKKIRIIGPNNIGREIHFQKDDFASSSDVMLRPRPMMPGGRQALVNILFQLKQMPGSDGRPGTGLTEREFRRSLRAMNMLPPEIEMEDKAEARIQTRINQLIGDTQRPQIPPASLDNINTEQVMEDHKTAMEMLRNTILDDSFKTYSPLVKKSLFEELEFHRSFTFGATEHPNAFDNSPEDLASVQSEEFLANSEYDLETPEGLFQSSLT